MIDSKTERAVVIFDSKYGNTGEIAKSLAGGLQRAGLEVDLFNIGEVKIETLCEYDLVAIGAPTQAFSASKPMKDFLLKLEGAHGLEKKPGFAFDTKLGSRFSGSASKYIEGRLARLGMEIVRPRQSAIVKGSEGPLGEGEPEAFDRIGFEIGTTMINPSVKA